MLAQQIRILIRFTIYIQDHIEVVQWLCSHRGGGGVDLPGSKTEIKEP